MQAKKFTQQALDAIANHSIADLAGNSHTRARQLAGMLSRQHKEEEMLGMVTPAAFIAGAEFRPATNANMPWKAQTRHQNPRGVRQRRSGPRTSGAQALAPLGATAAQNGPTAGGGHAGAKTVGAGSSDFTRLICSFHDSAPFSDLCVTPAVSTRRALWPGTGAGVAGFPALPPAGGHLPQRKAVFALNVNNMEEATYTHAAAPSSAAHGANARGQTARVL